MCNVFVDAQYNCVITERWLLPVFYLLFDLQPLLAIGPVKWLIK